MRPRLAPIGSRIAWRLRNVANASCDRAARLARSVRETGDRLTGGGLRSLARRVLTRMLRRAMHQPFLKALGQAVLQPFPGLSARVYRVATKSDSAVTPLGNAAQVVFTATVPGGERFGDRSENKSPPSFKFQIR
jgi:hypothetical protein